MKIRVSNWDELAEAIKKMSAENRQKHISVSVASGDPGFFQECFEIEIGGSNPTDTDPYLITE